MSPHTHAHRTLRVQQTRNGIRNVDLRCFVRWFERRLLMSRFRFAFMRHTVSSGVCSASIQSAVMREQEVQKSKYKMNECAQRHITYTHLLSINQISFIKSDASTLNGIWADCRSIYAPLIPVVLCLDSYSPTRPRSLVSNTAKETIQSILHTLKKPSHSGCWKMTFSFTHARSYCTWCIYK